MSLPEGLEFLEFGWWVMHAVAISLVWLYAYRKGRDDERKRRAKPPRQSGGDDPGG